MMFTLNKHIEYLIMRHDCVVIPGFGALVAHYSEPRYDIDKNVIVKPRRCLGFNSEVSHNDGMLAHSIVRREGISYDQAVRFIDHSVDDYKQILSSNVELRIGRIGVFKELSNGQVEFMPSLNESSYNQYFGLNDISMTSWANLENSHQDTGAVIVEKGWWSRKALQTAASIAVLIVLSIILTTPIIVNRNNHEQAALNTEVKGPKNEVVDAVADKALSLSKNAVTEQVLEEPSQEPSLLLDEGGSCYLIIASLNNPKQVNEFLAVHSDISPHARVLHNGKYYHVYVARSYQPSRLYSFMSKLPHGYQAWVLN